jgi:DNA gyrase inhibitor GyrI
MSSFIKKLVIIVSVVIFILFISLLIAAWTMGMFSTVSVTENNRGPYYAVTLSHRGSYQGISQKMDEVSVMLSENRIEHSVACAIFYDDPAKTDINELRSEGGFIVKDSMEISLPFKCLKIPNRSVGVASIKANPAIAGFKTYSALLDWIEKHNFKLDTLQPTIELYYTSGIVEVELPLLKTK